MSNIVVQDNFLPYMDFKVLQNKIISSHFPWYLTAVIGPDSGPNVIPDLFFKTENYNLVHTVYGQNRIYSDLYHEFTPLFDAMNLFSIFRLKINLNPRKDKQVVQGFHVDVPNAPKDNLTSIFYMNTNNGYTAFEDGTKTKSVENRLVTFPTSTRHATAINNCDALYRCVVNINWFRHEN